MLRLKQNALITILAFASALAISIGVANASDTSTSDANKIALFANLANAKTEKEGKLAEEAIWQYWFDQSPTTDVRAILDAGIERREAYDFEAAEKHFDKVVELAPNYAEGYNQRAFARFLRENYENSKTDLETAIKLEPDHFGALSGLYHVLQIQNRQKAAINMLQKAVVIHPWLRERLALPKDLWPENYRKIHGPGQEI